MFEISEFRFHFQIPFKKSPFSHKIFPRAPTPTKKKKKKRWKKKELKEIRDDLAR